MFSKMQTWSAEGRGRPGRGIILLATVALTSTGCGETESVTRVPVSGTVMVRDAPLDAGRVRFIPKGDTAGPVTIAKVTDGCYSLGSQNGPVVGDYRVEISATDFWGFDPGDQEAAECAMKSPGPPSRSPVPARYRRNSPLVAEIPPEGNPNLDFVLNSGGPSERRLMTSGPATP